MVGIVGKGKKKVKKEHKHFLSEVEGNHELQTEFFQPKAHIVIGQI